MYKHDPEVYGKELAAILDESDEKIRQSDKYADELKRIDDFRHDKAYLEKLRAEAETLEQRLYETQQSLEQELQLLEIEEYQRRIDNRKIGEAEKKVIRRVTEDMVKTMTFLRLFLEEISNLFLRITFRDMGLIEEIKPNPVWGTGASKTVDIDVDAFAAPAGEGREP